MRKRKFIVQESEIGKLRVCKKSAWSRFGCPNSGIIRVNGIKPSSNNFAYRIFTDGVEGWLVYYYHSVWVTHFCIYGL